MIRNAHVLFGNNKFEFEVTEQERRCEKVKRGFASEKSSLYSELTDYYSRAFSKSPRALSRISRAIFISLSVII